MITATDIATVKGLQPGPRPANYLQGYCALRFSVFCAWMGYDEARRITEWLLAQDVLTPECPCTPHSPPSRRQKSFKMKSPRLLDLYCCAGVGAIGYQQAGFHVTGIDKARYSTYAGDDHLVADALEVLADTAYLRQFDAIHASPPCQAFSTANAQFRLAGKNYPDYIQATRAGLEAAGRPYIIENVPQAPIRPDLVLYGWMFGLHVLRRRHFELGHWWAMQPGVPQRIGSIASRDFVSVFGKCGYRKNKHWPPDWRPKFQKATILDTWHYAMGISETHRFRDIELSQGIPPAYTNYIGQQLFNTLHRTAP